jgi:alpha-glucosidase
MELIKGKRVNYSESLGALVEYKQEKQSVDLKTTNAFVRVIVYEAGVIRLWISRWEDSFEDDFSYAVTGKPHETEYQLLDLEDKLIIHTAQVQLHIQKDPVRFEFYTNDLKLINQDDPAFGTSWMGSEVCTYKKLQPGERFIGMGEKTGNLDRRGRAYTHWNTDYFEYPVDGDPLYCSTPFYMGVHSGLSYGIFLDNSHKSVFNFGASNDRFASFSAAEGNMNYYFIHYDTVADIIKAYARLTGTITVPPLWSLGYQQCRYSYYPDKEVLNVARTFRDKNIPADVIYLDIHYMDAYKIFTWHPEHFSEPARMLKELRDMGFHVVVIVDPGIKKEGGYQQFDEGVARDLFLKYPDGENYTATVWPGDCYFPDFTKPETRDWWGAAFEGYVKDGLDGFWNDMNEPASWGQTTPDLIEFDFEGRGATHKEGRNVYGMQMARSTYEGTRKLMNGKRPFVLTRAGFSGVQRYSAVWTGDNVASDEHMMVGIRMVNSLGMAGVPYAGYDVGGFVGESSVALYTRWVSIGAFAPFFRGHTMINSRDSEPWSYGEEAEEISRNYINMRYKLMPYIYSLFFEASQTGMPVARSLAIDYTHDRNIYNTLFQNQYLFGPGILVAPVMSHQQISKVYLPEGEWFDLYCDRAYAGKKEYMVETPMDRLPLFIKGGSIIPMQSLVQYTQQEPDDVLMLHVYKGSQGGSFVYYEDDGQTYGYENGESMTRTFTYDNERRSFVISEKNGDYTSKFKRFKIYFHGFEGQVTSVSLNGNAINSSKEDVAYFKQITAFDPLYHQEGELRQVADVPYVELDATEHRITLAW